MLRKLKSAIKLVTPPIITNAYRAVNYGSDEVWAGDYKNWEEVKAISTGYDTDLILEKCKRSLLKVKNGEAVYERDSVIFDEIQYSFGVLAALYKAAISSDMTLNVLDFGGSLGSSYYQNRVALAGLKSLRWNIVEQDHFITCGKQFFEDDVLKFHPSVEDCIMAKGTPDVVLLSSVLQYLPTPYETLESLLAIGAKLVVLDITTFIDRDRDVLTLQTVPPAIYTASYPCWFFKKHNVVSVVEKYDYHIFGEWRATYPINMGYHGGLIFEKK